MGRKGLCGELEANPASWREKAEEENGRNAKAELSETALTWSCSHGLVSITRTRAGIFNTWNSSVPCEETLPPQRPHINGVMMVTSPCATTTCSAGGIPA